MLNYQKYSCVSYNKFLGKIPTKLVKYQAVLHVKPFNKLYLQQKD
jgi:hypothetical protein